MPLSPAAIAGAEQKIRPHIRKTPAVRSSALSERTQADVWLKCENLQDTGSFKLRGAVHALLCLSPDQQARGVVAASSGNHGAAVAVAGQMLGVPVTVYVPEGASPVKRDVMRRAGASVVTFGTDGLDTEIEARRVAGERNQAYVSPYNDAAVVVGQGTVGVELLRQVDGLDALIVAVGGGGLIAGMTAYLRHALPALHVIGAQPANSNVMAASIRAGRVLELPSQPTLSDGTAGGIERDTITFELCRDLVDDWVEIDESSIARSLRHAIEVEHMLVEGSAAVALAALDARRETLGGKRVAVVLCGANISADTLRRALED
jgi:threonine dehydratase